MDAWHWYACVPAVVCALPLLFVAAAIAFLVSFALAPNVFVLVVFVVRVAFVLGAFAAPIVFAPAAVAVPIDVAPVPSFFALASFAAPTSVVLADAFVLFAFAPVAV